MALNFTTTLATKDGFEVANAYGRVSVTDSYAGDSVHAVVEAYVSEQAFNEGANPLKTKFLPFAQTDYDRAVDGTDVLDIAHDALIAKLAEQGINATKVL